MRVHHLNCLTMCPVGGKLVDGEGGRGPRGRLVCHVLLLETPSHGLVLVDTGFGLEDVAHPTPRLSRFFLAQLRPDLREEWTAYRQLERLGLDPGDVRHVLLTHLDFDHAGGLDDFPHATVHLLESERDAAFAQNPGLDRLRYRPLQWGTKERWRTYRPHEGEPWFGFDCVRALDGLPADILLVPLVGHTFGHAGVAIWDGDRWLLHAGDAYFFHAELDPERPRCTPGLRLYQWMMEKDRAARRWNQARLRELRRDHGGQVTIFSGHDVVEFERLTGRGFREREAPLPRAGLEEAAEPYRA